MEEKKYQVLINYIKGQLAEGILGPGDKLFSENEFMNLFQVSRQTVRKAMEILEEEGIINRVKGSGTYIKDKGYKQRGDIKRIAVVTTYLDSYIFPRTIQGIESYLFERGYTVQLSFTNNTLERERMVLEDIIQNDDVAGVIVEGTKSGLPNPNLHLYRKLIERKVPIVFINSFYPELKLPHVTLNDVQAAAASVEYLLKKGHKEVGAILKLDDGQGRLRYLGYLQAMLLAGRVVGDKDILWIHTEDAKQLAHCEDRVLELVKSKSAIFCYNDEIAFQLIQLLTKNQIKVPKEVSVIGVDDSDLAGFGEVQITSMPHPKEELGRKAAEILLGMVCGNGDPESYEFNTKVVERASVTTLV